MERWTPSTDRKYRMLNFAHLPELFSMAQPLPTVALSQTSIHKWSHRAWRHRSTPWIRERAIAKSRLRNSMWARASCYYADSGIRWVLCRRQSFVLSVFLLCSAPRFGFIIKLIHGVAGMGMRNTEHVDHLCKANPQSRDIWFISISELTYLNTLSGEYRH